MSNEILYVVTTAEKRRLHLYKIGIHNGTFDMLLNKYRTNILNP